MAAGALDPPTGLNTVHALFTAEASDYHRLDPDLPGHPHDSPPGRQKLDGLYSIGAMFWGEVELEPEVRDWYLALGDDEQGRADFHIDRLAQEGPLLGEPHTKQLDGKLRELRFYLGSQAIRVTYWIAPGRRIILLTVFVKTRRQERRQIERAKRAMETCIAEEHTAKDDDG